MAAASHRLKPRYYSTTIHILLATFLCSSIVGSNAEIRTATHSCCASSALPSSTAAAGFVASASRASIVSSQQIFIQKKSKDVHPYYLKHRNPVILTRESNCNVIGAAAARPHGALSDIVVPSVFNLSDWTNNKNNNVNNNKEEEEDPRIWVPQTPTLSFRPLCLCTSQGYYVNLLKFTGGGILGRHRHSSPVHALTLQGSWKYREHENKWHAHPGTYVFEPPGETHTLIVDADCDTMVALFHVTGSLLYVDEDDKLIGYDDVFTKLEKARKWYEECGLGVEYVDQFIR